MVLKKQLPKEDRRKDTERRKSNIQNYDLLNLDRPDKRSGSDRRSGKERVN